MSPKVVSLDLFGAVVTGELTQYSSWIESKFDAVICNYFFTTPVEKRAFESLILHCKLTFEQKIDVIREIALELGLPSQEALFKEIIEFKAIANAFADNICSPLSTDSHKERVAEGDKILLKLDDLIDLFKTSKH